MNSPLSIKSSAVATIPAMAMFLMFQACGGGGDAVAQQAAADPVEGVWEGVVTPRDCTSSAPVGTFRGSQVYHRGGTMSDTNGQAPNSRGPGFGTWTREGSTYTAKFRLFTYDPATGALTGTMRATRTFTLSADGNTQTSTNTSQAEDLNGTVTRTGCATDLAKRAP